MSGRNRETSQKASQSLKATKLLLEAIRAELAVYEPAPARLAAVDSAIAGIIALEAEMTAAGAPIPADKTIEVGSGSGTIRIFKRSWFPVGTEMYGIQEFAVGWGCTTDGDAALVVMHEGMLEHILPTERYDSWHENMNDFLRQCYFTGSCDFMDIERIKNGYRTILHNRDGMLSMLDSYEEISYTLPQLPEDIALKFWLREQEFWIGFGILRIL